MLQAIALVGGENEVEIFVLCQYNIVIFVYYEYIPLGDSKGGCGIGDAFYRCAAFFLLRS